MVFFRRVPESSRPPWPFNAPSAIFSPAASANLISLKGTSQNSMELFSSTCKNRVWRKPVSLGSPRLVSSAWEIHGEILYKWR